MKEKTIETLKKVDNVGKKTVKEVIKETKPIKKEKVIKEVKKIIKKEIKKPLKDIKKPTVETKKILIKKSIDINKKNQNINKLKSKNITLEELEEAMKTGKVFDALVKTVDSDLNLHVFFAHGLKGFIPREEVSSITGENGLVEEKLCLGKEEKIMQVCIKEIKQNKGIIEKVILSRRELELKVRRWMFMHLKDGMKLKGIIRGMTDYAAFVDVGGGVTGMLKIEEISYVRIMKVSDKLKLGQRLEVIVKKFDKDTGKIDLSIKELAGTFKEKVSKLTEGSMVDGIVRNREKNGIFVELTDDLVGLAEHVSGVEYGQKVLVHIKKINVEKERIKLKIIG